MLNGVELTAVVERAKAEILADMASGRVPFTVVDFAQLHDYVDANEYGGLCEEGFLPEGWFDDQMLAGQVMSFANAVQDEVCRWLASRWVDIK